MTLNQIKLHQTVQIKEIHGTASFKHQLFSMGIFPHALITLIQQPPFHNPLIFQVTVSIIALRIDDAMKIEVLP